MSGFRFVDDDVYRKVEPIELGDEAYKRLWPKALWPTDIPRHSPLSFIARFMTEIDVDGSRPKSLTYLLPEEAELVWVGNIGSGIAFYGDIIFLQKDFGGQEPQSWATLKGWLQFQSVAGVENKLNFRLGTVGTQSMGLFTARDANFYGTHFYLYTTWSMPPVNLEAAGLAEFGGNNFAIAPQMGLELNGFGRRWWYAAGSVSGNVKTSPTGVPENAVSFVGMGQGSGGEDFYLQLAYKIGGLAFDRSREPPSESLTPGAEFWRDDSWIFSLFGYRGVADITTVDLEGTSTESKDEFWRLGAGVQKQIRDISLSVAYLIGRNDNPYGSLTDESVDSENWHFEILGFAYPWLIPYLRYEGLGLDMPQGVPGINPNQDIERLIGGIKFMIRPNVFCTTEFAYYTEGAELEEGFDQTLFILLGVSF